MPQMLKHLFEKKNNYGWRCFPEWIVSDAWDASSKAKGRNVQGTQHPRLLKILQEIQRFDNLWKIEEISFPYRTWKVSASEQINYRVLFNGAIQCLVDDFSCAF